MKNEKRYYKRVESYYNVTSRNTFYSEIMKDLMLIILPVLGIAYAVSLREPHPDDLVLIYLSILMCMSTIGLNFLAQCCSAKCNSDESGWAEEEMTRLNDEKEEKSEESKEGWGIAVRVFNYMSYAFLAVSFVLFYMLVK